MKTRKTMLTAISITKLSFVISIAVLAGLILAGCGESPGDNSTVYGSMEDVLIWQVYGGTGASSSVSHPFVELYNTSNNPVQLNGSYLWYAGSHKILTEDGGTEDLACDTPWKKFPLTGTIPGRSSFLIRGKASTASDSWRMDITDVVPDMDMGDMDNGVGEARGFTLNNRGFKIVIIKGTFDLTQGDEYDPDDDTNLLVQGIPNPFNHNGGKVPGYIDMIGALNSAPEGDRLYGYEGEPIDFSSVQEGDTPPYARCSNQEAVRRKSLTDTDSNVDDFQSMRYTTKHFTGPDSTTVGHVNGIEDSELALYKPRNTRYGAWDPSAITRATKGDPDSTQPVEPGEETETLMILQIGAATDGNISHSFVELYNNTDASINLSGYSLQYAEGTRGTPEATEDGPWQKIDLTGTVQPYHSFLILGSEGVGQTGNPALDLSGVTGDMNETFVISNRSFKVVLLSNTTLLTVQNPFDTGSGAKVAGYVDMVGAMNTVGEDKINGYETSAITDLNKQTGQRRTSLTDTDDNKADFARATYVGASAANLELWRPKNHAYGAWNPVTGVKDGVEPNPPALLILQIGAATDGNISHSFVELYNNTDSEIDMGEFSVQYAAGTKVADGATEDGEWNVIALTGKKIGAHNSFLILGKKGTAASPALSITDNSGDINDDTLELSNRAVKVALMGNQTKLTVQNPFDTDGSGTKAAGYIDMVGAINDNTDQLLGYEGSPAHVTKQVGIRRISLDDTDNNADDFENVTYANIPAEEKEFKRPKNTTDGEWDPIPESEPNTGGETVAGTEDELAKKLLILQAYGGDGRSGGPSYNFIELYNTTESSIDLDGYTVQYASVTDNGGGWKVVPLTGSIPSKGSYLITGTIHATGAGHSPSRFDIPENYGDVRPNDFALDNQGFKVVIIKSTDKLTVPNPFSMTGGKAAGYVDMVGCMNTFNVGPNLAGEGTTPFTALPRNSAQEGIRRKNLTDTDVNTDDFQSVRYTTTRTGGYTETGVDDDETYQFTPKNSAYGAWDPFEKIDEDPYAD